MLQNSNESQEGVDKKEANPRDLGSKESIAPLDGLRILLAEDCADQGRLYLQFLKVAGADVTLECNGAAAVDAVSKAMRRNKPPFDAIVMDFEMPELDGLDATQKIRRMGHEAAILAITALYTEDLRTAWIDAGCDGFYEKPLKREALIEAVLAHVESSAV